MKEIFHRLVIQVQRHAYLLVYGTYPPGTLVKYFYSGTLIEQVQQSIDPATFPRESDSIPITQCPCINCSWW